MFVFVCYALLYVHSSFAIILKREREREREREKEKEGERERWLICVHAILISMCLDPHLN